MVLSMAQVLSFMPTLMWWLIAGVILIAVLHCLRILAGEIDWALRVHRLTLEAHQLRESQNRQLLEHREAQKQAREAARQKRDSRKRLPAARALSMDAVSDSADITHGSALSNNSSSTESSHAAIAGAIGSQTHAQPDAERNEDQSRRAAA